MGLTEINILIYIRKERTLLKGKDILTSADFSREMIDYVMDTAGKFEAIARGKEQSDILKGKVLALAFYQPSTRTQNSFELAMKKLGGVVIGFSSPAGTAVEKGESLADTVRVLEGYSDVLVIRHPEKGAPAHVADILDIPVINGGDDANQHPTQALLDMYTIQKAKGTVDGLVVGVIADVPKSRTVKSLAYALSNYNVKVYFVAPEKYQLPDDISADLDNRGADYEKVDDIHEIISELDILYCDFRSAFRVTEKYESEEEKEIVKKTLFVTRDLLKGAKPALKIMHPLPRYDELPSEIDGTPHALYFEQSRNGIPVRMGLLSSILGYV